jgi:hypothetical protein
MSRRLEPEEIEFNKKINMIFLSEELSFEDAVREYRRIEAEFVERERDTEWKVVETRRRITEWILKHAHYDDQPQEVCREIWHELLQRGFSDITTRHSMSGIYAGCCLENGAFEEGLAVIAPLIAECEQALADPTLPPNPRAFYEYELESNRKIRDALEAGDRGDTEEEEPEPDSTRTTSPVLKFVRRTSDLFRHSEAENMSFEKEFREMRRIEAECVQRAVDGGWDVLDTQRRILGWILRRALDRRAPLDVCREIWEEMLQRGFSDPGRRLLESSIYAQCCQLHGAFEEGLAILEPLIPEAEQALAKSTLPEPYRRDYENFLQRQRELRDELKAGIRK